MSIFKYVTFDYWYDRWEERQRKSIRKQIDNLKSVIESFDKIIADQKSDEKDIEHCTLANYYFREELERLESKLKYGWL